MDFDLTIGGVAKQLLAGSLNIRQVTNSRHTASFELDSADRSYRPAMDAEVIMERDGTRIFGGLIDQKPEFAQAGPKRPGIRSRINVVDFGAYTERRFVNETFPEQTLKQRLQAIVDGYLDDYGVTLHASQVNGPTLPSVVYDDTRVDEVLAQTIKLTADLGQVFVWKMSYAKVLRAFQPSTSLAPFDLVGNDLDPEVRGDVEVDPSNDGQANQVIVKLTPKSETGRIESFTGDGVTDTFQLHYTPTKFLYGIITMFELDDVTPAGGETFWPSGASSPVQWEYDPITNTIIRLDGPTDATKIYKITFDGTFSGRWEATDASWTSTPSSRRQKVITLESIPEDASGQAFADAELAKSLTGPIYVKYKTWENGIEPGQQQTINISARNVNADGVVTEVVIRDQFDHLEYSVTVVVDDAQTNLDRTWGDVYKLWGKFGSGGGGGGTVIGSGGATVLGPAPPNKSVQRNEAGAFGGSEWFTFDSPDGSLSLVCGEDSSITAFDAQSCQVFGLDNHIADP